MVRNQQLPMKPTPLPTTHRLTHPALVLTMLGLCAAVAAAAPKVVLISLDGANPAILAPYIASNALPPGAGLRLLEAKGVKASRNNTINPSLTAAAHVAIATGSGAAANDVVSNSYQLLASPFNGAPISGFGGPIGGYSIDGPLETAFPTAEPLWIALRANGKTVSTATWPGGDGVNVTIPGLTGTPGSASNPIVQPASERTVDYTVPFGASMAPFQKGFSLTAADFSPAPASTGQQLTAAGKVFFGQVMQTSLETFTTGGVTYNIKAAAYDTSDDSQVNYDTVVLFNQAEGIQPGPFSLPSTGPAYIKPGTQAGAGYPTLSGRAPLVLGHRGTAGRRPEHTLESYRYAIELGADFVEPDLVSTKDGVLIARHEPMIGGTTDVASHTEFADRKTTKVLDGVSVTDWFASDFTLAEMKTLRAIQPTASRPQQFNGLYEIPTFEEIILLVKTESAARGRTVGVYAETKHPTFHDSLGLSLEEPLLASLTSAGWNRADAPVFIQSFEVSNLKELNTRTEVKLVQLIDADDVKPDGSLSLVAPYAQPYDFVVSGDPRTFADLLTPAGLASVHEYADGVGPWKPYLLKTRIYDSNNDGTAEDRNNDGTVNVQDREVVGDTGVVAAAHEAGLFVHPYTFRNDSGLYGFASPAEEYKAFYSLGVDGVFSDFADTARAALTNISALFYFEGHSSKAGTRYFVSRLAPDLSSVRIARASATFIPRNAAVLADVDDINTHVGFWQPQADFRIVEKLDATPSTFLNFPDVELESIYMELVREFVTYQTNVGLRAIARLPDADLVMMYIEQPDGSAHQFLLTDPRQPTDFTNPASIGAGQDPIKKERYAGYLKAAYQTANNAVQRVIDAVGVDADGRPPSNVMVTSDHGFAPFHTQVQITQILTDAGITGIGSTPASRVKVVTSGPAANIYINLQGREPGSPPVGRVEYIVLQKKIAAALRAARDTNPVYAPGGTPLFDKVHLRPLPADINDPSFGRRTDEVIGQDSGDVYALLDLGYNFDGRQTPAVVRQGDSSGAVLSLPNFYGAHGYDPSIEEMSAVFYAAGPNVVPSSLGEISNIDIAPTIDRILGVTPAATVEGTAMLLGPAPLTLMNAAVRKTHGSAGDFDFVLPLTGTRGIEPRPGQSAKPPLVLGHRGASGYRPEHTLASYQTAISLGADYIEPDLVLTKDGVPIARHEPLFGATAVNGVPVSVPNEFTTTNILDHPEFADRLRTRNLDGTNVTGFWADDFTLAEVKTLLARERIPTIRPGNVPYNDLYQIPTLQEVIDLAKSQSALLGRTIGIYPETKHPTFFLLNAANRTNAARFEDIVVSILHANYGNTPDAPVFLQSFEVSNLQYLASQTSIKKIQLINTGATRPYDFVAAGDPRTYNDIITPAGLEQINDYAFGIGPTRDLIIPRPGNILGTPTSLIADAHAASLEVHAFTFRAENNFLSNGYRIGSNPAAYGNYQDETLKYLYLGMDGLFTDQADFGVRAVKAAEAAAHQLVFTFSNPIVSGTAAVTAGPGAASVSFSGNEMRVHLTGVPDGQTVSVTLTNVTDAGSSILPPLTLSVGFLAGDVNRDGVVDAKDTAEIKSITATPTAISVLNARADVKLDGKLNIADAAAVKASLGHSAPVP